MIYIYHPLLETLVIYLHGAYYAQSDCVRNFLILYEMQIVLDESNNATTRARANAEAMAKYKQRKINIEKALFIRLITDDNEEENIYGMKTECGSEDDGKRADAPVASPPVVIARKIVTIQEEDSDDEETEFPSTEEREARENSSPVDTAHCDRSEEIASEGDEEGGTAPPLLPTPNSPSRSSPQSLTLDHHQHHHHIGNSSPSSRLSSLADALNCGIHSRLTSCSYHAKATCGNILQTTNGGSNGGGRSDESAGGTHLRTISHSEMFSRYDDECNICLTQFQVGDSAAWSMLHGKMVLAAGDTPIIVQEGVCGATMRDSGLCNSGATMDENVCRHVFHEECISRWLLVRDGCPTCRRSYFPATTADNPGNEVDLEHGEIGVSRLEEGARGVGLSNDNRETSLAVSMATE